jgi:dipeptidyl aminopeptidase/acylaminoacyl peptidase
MKNFTRPLVVLFILVFSQMFAMAQTVKSESVVLENKKRIPASVFFAQPGRTMVTISPDGLYLAYLAPFKETLNLFVEPVNGGTPVRLSMQSGNPVECYQWASEEVICFQLASADFNTKAVFAAQISAPEDARMISTESMDARLIHMNAVSAGAFHFMQKSPDSSGFDLVNFNFEFGALTTVNSGKGSGIYQYFVGYDGGRTVALESAGVMNRLLFVEGQGRLKKVMEYPATNTFIPVAFDLDNKTSILAISDINRKNAALVRLDYLNGNMSKVLLEEENYDVVKTHNNLGSTNVLEVELMGEKMQVKAFNSAYEKIREEIAAKIENKAPFVLDCVDRKGNNFIVHTFGPRHAPVYYRYNAPNKELKLVANTNRDLVPLYLADMNPAKFVNRDGNEVAGAIVRPHAGSIQAPVVIYLPESPEKKVLNEYNPEIQFLVNSGFVVWVVDYMGNDLCREKLSVGDGAAWAQLMRDDLIDVAKYLIQQGTAHPDKISIFAQGLAGPMVASALITQPDLFCSAVYSNAVFDYSGFFNGHTMMARDHSPVVELLKLNNSLASYPNVISGNMPIKQPLLFISSNYDECFSAQQSNEAAVALARTGNTPEIIAVEDGHDIFREENKIIVWDGVVDFLKRNHKEKSNNGGSDRVVPDRNATDRK